jgi:hypothetical protein
MLRHILASSSVWWFALMVCILKWVFQFICEMTKWDSKQVLQVVTDTPSSVLPTGHGYSRAFRVWTGQIIWTSSRLVHKPHPLLLGSPIPNVYQSIPSICQVWLVPSVPISGSCVQVYSSVVTFRYLTVNRKILTLAHCCHCSFNLQPLSSKRRKTYSLPHPENYCQQSIHEFWSSMIDKILSTRQLNWNCWQLYSQKLRN